MPVPFIHVARCAGAVALLAGGLLASAAAPSHAETAYRYWSLWQGNAGTWQYSQTGLSGHVRDGDVEGWRFAVQTKSGADAAKPRRAPDFGALCGDTPAQNGKIRVGLVVDFGTASDAPDGEVPGALVSTCVLLGSDVPAWKVLDTARLTMRVDQRTGLLCGIDGYPKPPECAPIVKVTTTAPQPPRSPQTEEPAAQAVAEPVQPARPIRSAAPGQPGASSRAMITSPSPAPSATSTPTALVADVRPGSGGTGNSGSGSVPVAALGGVLVAVLAGAATWQYRRRSHR